MTQATNAASRGGESTRAAAAMPASEPLAVIVTCRLVFACGDDAFQVFGAPDQDRSDGMENVVAV